VDESYARCVAYEKGKKVIYTVFNKALYGTVQASLLFWTRLSAFLVDKDGFVHNPCDYCVVNKVVDRKQCTVVWYVDDLKVSHVEADIVGEIMELMRKEFRNHLELTITQGKVHYYLGIQIDFSKKGKVIMTMFDYIDELLKECPEDLMKGASFDWCTRKPLYQVPSKYFPIILTASSLFTLPSCL
jgi:Reverse transcriptase (RNA-dependent DNA polymerase)